VLLRPVQPLSLLSGVSFAPPMNHPTRRRHTLQTADALSAGCQAKTLALPRHAAA